MNLAKLKKNKKLYVCLFKKKLCKKVEWRVYSGENRIMRTGPKSSHIVQKSSLYSKETTRNIFLRKSWPSVKWWSIKIWMEFLINHSILIGFFISNYLLLNSMKMSRIIEFHIIFVHIEINMIFSRITILDSEQTIFWIDWLG